MLWVRKGGNSISFLQDLQAITYPEALKYVAQKYNIEIIEEELSDKQIQEKSIKEGLYDVTSFAENYFEDILWNTTEGKNIGLSYFKERGFNEEIIKKFKLGYNPKGPNTLEKAAINAGYDKKILLNASLIGENNDGKVMISLKKGQFFQFIHMLEKQLVLEEVL